MMRIGRGLRRIRFDRIRFDGLPALRVRRERHPFIAAFSTPTRLHPAPADTPPAGGGAGAEGGRDAPSPYLPRHAARAGSAPRP